MRGAAVRAVNQINSAGGASLALSLLRMTQLTSLVLSCMLRACIGGQLCCERVLANAGRAWMMLRAVG